MIKLTYTLFVPDNVSGDPMYETIAEREDVIFGITTIESQTALGTLQDEAFPVYDAAELLYETLSPEEMRDVAEFFNND